MNPIPGEVMDSNRKDRKGKNNKKEEESGEGGKENEIIKQHEGTGKMMRTRGKNLV
jgi:hypothetical protein